ncbi:YwmB family TATA-box binding protein [Chengkuizengella marina]|uniref:TATA-box binding n=1 Tax=Chengkuizengella marina TaxID=2507566 RepID=A0A6N9Q5G9_9BACL|nr:YwmB family TATA-box binding protein [Chengkuizengella marina]NBI30105.1 hypothetical protein [Chengkuizengella marina]
MLTILKNKIMYSLFLIIILLISSLSYYIYANPKDDFSQFLSLSEEIFPENYTFILKHSSFYKNYNHQEDFVQLGNLLMDELQMPLGESLIELNHLVYISKVEIDKGTNLSVRLTGMNNDKSTYLTIILESNNQSLNYLSMTKMNIESALQKLDIKVNWNLMIQGKYTNSGSEFQKLWKQLDDVLQLNEIETYTDQRTISTSYYSPALNTKIVSGSNSMNLQVALHQNSLNEEWQLTIGSPIITIEY